MLRRAISLGLAVLVLAADQASKLWALEELRPIGRRAVQIIPGCFHLAYAENRSAAFGILGFLPLELRRHLLTGDLHVRQVRHLNHRYAGALGGKYRGQ